MFYYLKKKKIDVSKKQQQRMENYICYINTFILMG